LIQLIVTHMLSDGYTIVPLVADLAQLVARAEARFANPVMLSAALPPLPNALEAVQKRIVRTIYGDNSFGDLITHDQLRRESWGRDVCTHLATLPSDIVGTIRRVARCLAISDDIVMLSALGATLARYQNQQTIVMSMVAPQRDGPGESDMVGLFADIRIVTVRTGGLSYAGTALQVQHIVKERLWSSPPIVSQCDLPFVNFEWTDFESHHGIRQLVHQREGHEQLSNPMKVAVDQPDPSTWRMRCAFDGHCHKTEDQDRFFVLFEATLNALANDPLTLIWPPDVAADLH